MTRYVSPCCGNNNDSLNTNLGQQPLDPQVTNSSFELDTTGTSRNNLTGWAYASESEGGTPVSEMAEVTASASFKGNNSLSLSVRSDNQGNCQSGKRNANQFLIANNGQPVNSVGNYVTVWVRDQNWSTPSRYDFQQKIWFNEGAFPVNNPQDVDERERFFRQHWRGDRDIDNVKETRVGSDGNEWKRYTIEIPNTIDKNNVSFAVVNHMDAWDCNSGTGSLFVDQINVTDETGQVTEPGCTVGVPGVGDVDCVTASIVAGVGVVGTGALLLTTDLNDLV